MSDNFFLCTTKYFTCDKKRLDKVDIDFSNIIFLRLRSFMDPPLNDSVLKWSAYFLNFSKFSLRIFRSSFSECSKSHFPNLCFQILGSLDSFFLTSLS